jgi:hypothetical protein
MRSTGSGRLAASSVACLDRRQIGQMLAFGPDTEIAHHVGLDVRGEDLAFGNALGDARAEIAGADIGDERCGVQMQRVQNVFRLLPGVPFGIVEFLRPLFRIIEVAMETFARSGMARVVAAMPMLRRWFGSGLRPSGA